MAKKRATKGNDQLHLEVPDENDLGIDPHKKTLTASVLSPGGLGDELRTGTPLGHSKAPAPSVATSRCS